MQIWKLTRIALFNIYKQQEYLNKKYPLPVKVRSEFDNAVIKLQHKHLRILRLTELCTPRFLIPKPKFF